MKKKKHLVFLLAYYIVKTHRFIPSWVSNSRCHHYYYFRIYNISLFPFRRSHEFNLSDCAPYFLSNVKRLSDSAYIPTTQDILHTRIPTCGIVEVRNFSKCADIICVSFFSIIFTLFFYILPLKLSGPWGLCNLHYIIFHSSVPDT